LDHVIASLEALHKGTTAELPGRKKSNRGRNRWGDERLEVSERMRKYWEARRKKKILAAG